MNIMNRSMRRRRRWNCYVNVMLSVINIIIAVCDVTKCSDCHVNERHLHGPKRGS